MTRPPSSSARAEVGTRDRTDETTGHRRQVRRPLGTYVSRRVSGPSGPGLPPDAPARSWPRAKPEGPTERSSEAARTRASRIRARTAALLVSLPDHPLLDRIVRGRAWIPLLGVMLVGIVATQVEVLKLGASVGRSVQQSTQLTMTNEQLQASVATLADDQRIERMAARMGMVMPAPNAVGFLSVHGNRDVGKAIANIHAPNAANFLALLTSNGAVVSTPSQSTTASGAVLANAAGTATAPGATATATTPTAPTATPVTPSATAPSTTAPSTSVPSTSAPSATAPSSTVPSSTVPSATAPSSTVPSSTVPSSTAPSSTIPSSTAPSTSQPAAASTPGAAVAPTSSQTSGG